MYDYDSLSYALTLTPQILPPLFPPLSLLSPLSLPLPPRPRGVATRRGHQANNLPLNLPSGNLHAIIARIPT